MGNKPYALFFMPLASDDLGEIYTHISERLAAPAAADHLLDKIENKLNLLCEFPGLGAELSDPYLAEKGYHRLLVDNYLIFYLIDEIERKIIVMRILYGARDYQDIL